MMRYQSTRKNYEKVKSSEAIQLGMVPSGGLFVPEDFPRLSEEEVRAMEDESYQEIAYRVLSKFLTDFSEDVLRDVISNSYSGNFDSEEIVPLTRLGDDLNLLELWHGPTAAFKDLALQFMPRLLTRTMEREMVILVATSGDTGKAALEGFKDVEGTTIVVFYPKEGVSELQKLQMVTTGGDNTSVVALEGDFDDCQSGVKEIFGDNDFKSQFSQAFSSANSINWGRLVPQIVYWFSAYSNLMEEGEIKFGDKIDIVVPTGNFGNILSSYYAHKIGLPVENFVCASNENNVLTDFIRTGVYDANRELKKTISPAMDILISSNLERFVFDITGGDAAKVREWYGELAESGKFTIDEGTKGELDGFFYGEYATEGETLETISKVFDKHEYPLDPHTAVGVSCYYKYRKRAGSERSALIASTANPFKFAPSVVNALTGEKEEGAFENLRKLKKITGWPVHRGLRNLKDMEIRHDITSTREDIRETIKEILSKR